MNIDFKQKADKYTPILFKSEYKPQDTVAFVTDNAYYQDTKQISVKSQQIFDTGDSICLDFGRHLTGYFKFDLEQADIYIDAPVRLKIKFAETPYEMHRDFDTYTGELSFSWLQEEIINVDLKGEVKLPRRYSFRYAKITVVKTQQKIKLDNFTAEGYTSADFSKLEQKKLDGIAKKLDTISQNTLAECMQDFFEDGPKRDRRLWLGDFRLQALANYYTFNNSDIVKRCLYLFAAFDSPDRLLPSYVYTKPDLETGNAYIVSYALLFTVSLCDYFEHTRDLSVTLDLFDVAKRQIDLTEKMLDKNGILVMPDGYGWWSFTDWSDSDPSISTMGIYIYTVCAFAKLCRVLERTEDEKHYNELLEKLKSSALKHLYDGEIFRSDYGKNQYAVDSQIWMILAEVVPSEDAKRILHLCLENEKFIQPVTPYMHHYVVEALIKSGLENEAAKYIKNYWGAMAENGADTFWEVFVKDDPYRSPYGDTLMNSACHAWSCTPTYFIRKYFGNNL